MQIHDSSPSNLNVAFSHFLSRRSMLEKGQKPAFEKLVLLLSSELSRGHNCITIDHNERDLLLKSGLAGLPDSMVLPLPLMIENSRLYLYRYWFYENRLALQIKSMNGISRPVANLGDLLDRYFGTNASELDWQREAADKAARLSFTMITGGPGTGKTTTVVKILGLLQEMSEHPLSIALAAPTGKAAVRLEESIANNKASLPCSNEIKQHIPDNVSTLHRLLGARPPSPFFSHHADNPLPYDLIVVDEASMIDLALMSKLLDALKPSARLILLGDKDQLASIESGSVLADLTAALPEQTLELKKTHRFDENIKKLALQINLQLCDAAWQQFRCGNPSISLLESDYIDFIARQQERYLKLIADGTGFSKVNQARTRFQVLAANKLGGNSVTDINFRVEQNLFRKKMIVLSGTWYAGRPVLISQNNPSLHLYNGDTGICMPDPEQNGKLMVFFQGPDGSIKKLAPSRISHCETAYAMTIHKSQGSEFEEVLIVLPSEISPILTKELLYTAVTRAKKTVRLVADEAVFKTAIKQKTQRTTGLIDKLITTDLQSFCEL